MNLQTKKYAGVLLFHETQTGDMSGALCFGKLDFLLEYWQMPLAPEAQELFTVITLDGLYTPVRVPRGASNATSCFEGTLARLLRTSNQGVWVNDHHFREQFGRIA